MAVGFLCFLIGHFEGVGEFLPQISFLFFQRHTAVETKALFATATQDVSIVLKPSMK